MFGFWAVQKSKSPSATSSLALVRLRGQYFFIFAEEVLPAWVLVNMLVEDFTPVLEELVLNNVAVGIYLSTLWVRDSRGWHALVVAQVSICIVEADSSFLVNDSFVSLVRLFSFDLSILLDLVGGLFDSLGHSIPVQRMRDSFVSDFVGEIAVKVLVCVFGYAASVFLNVSLAEFLFGFDPTVMIGNGINYFPYIGV